MKLTKDQKDAYILTGGGYCPFCNSKRVHHSKPALEYDYKKHMNVIGIEVFCTDCKQDWMEIYDFSELQT